MLSNTSQITFVGLGNMGAALAKAQLKAGATITGWNRTKEKPEVSDLISSGAAFEQDVGKAIAASSTVILCVLDYGTLYKILGPVAKEDGGPLRGRTIVNLTNGTPKDARKMDEWMQARGVHKYLDGGVMAGPDMIGTEQSFVFYSGADQATFDELKQTLQVFGRPDYYGQDPGAAALFDLSLLAGMYGMLQGAIIAISLLRKQPKDVSGDVGKKEEGPIERQVKTLLNPLLQAFMASHVRIAHSIEHDDFAAHGHPMDMQTVAMQNVARACEEEGIDGSVFKHFFGLVEKHVDHGGGKDNIASLLNDLVQR